MLRHSMYRFYRKALTLSCLLIFLSAAHAQKKDKAADAGTPILWEKVNIAEQDLYLGPGGTAMQPDLRSITFLGDQKSGTTEKYRIKDGSGRTWIAKIGVEAQPETAAVRLLSAIGYKTEINYLVPNLTIPGRGSFKNVRLEARPDNVKRGKAWNWGKSPFEGSRQMQGLKIMMAFFSNWDTKNSNNDVLTVGRERRYIVSDLGATFGKTGKVGMPLFWRFGRSKNQPGHYSKGKFVTGVKKDRVSLHFNGMNRGPIRNVSVADARWLASLLTQLSERQIKDAFRAANYSANDINTLTRAVKNRISQLDRVADVRLAGK